MKKTWLSFLFLIVVTIMASSDVLAADAEFSYPPTISLDEVQNWVDKASPDHPRLFATAADFDALRGSLKDDPTKNALAEAIVHQADVLQDAKPIERKLEGKRLLGQSRRCVKRVLTLAMAYQLTGEDRYAARAEQEMLAAARFSDWNPSHFLDVGEMTFALAVGYDWLYGQLDADTRMEIRQAIIQKGLVLPFENKHKGWVRAKNNWGQVCHGGLTVGALAVMEDEPRLAAKTVHNALHNVTNSMAAYAPRGSYPEGPGYWSYGTSYNVLLIDALESVLGSDFGLTLAPGFSVTGQYVSLACGPSGEFFNYADGGAGRSLQPALYWFASRYARPDWLLGERKLLKENLPKLATSRSVSDKNRLLPMTLLWMDAEADNVENNMPLNWSSGGEVPIRIHRSSWTDPNATYIGLKGGAPEANHGQMDIGSFVLDADGVRWAVDLGSEGYHGIESRGMNLWDRKQTSDRWTIFRQMNHGHNTLVIDDQLQRADGHGRFVWFIILDEIGRSVSVLDMSEVYQGQAEKVRRTVILKNSEGVQMEDQLEGLKPGSRVRWGMVTPATPGPSGGRTMELQQQGQRMTLEIHSPVDATWQIIDTATPRNDWDSANQGTRMIAFEAIAPASGKLELIVEATPGSCSE